MTDQPLIHPPHRAREDQAAPRSGVWRRMRRFARRLPLIDHTFAAYYCARDRRTPRFARMALFGAIGYFIMPFDVIPDFFPGIGHIDDAAVLFVAIRLVAHRITPDHHERARLRLDRLLG